MIGERRHTVAQRKIYLGSLGRDKFGNICFGRIEMVTTTKVKAELM